MPLIRLDKFLSERTAHSRAALKKILRDGAVTVDGTAERDGRRKIDPDVQTVTCMGKPLRASACVYYILNKPEGYVSATEDRDHATVLDLVPAEMRVSGLFPAGRLDGDSTGLVLLTNDGALAHQMLSPRHHVPKYYLVELARPYEAAYETQFAAGLTLSDGTECLPAQILPLAVPGHFALVCLHEGKYHQVKRMLAAVENHVVHLHRVAVGAYVLPLDLASGACLEIFHKDVEKLLKPGDLTILRDLMIDAFSSYLINARHEL